MAEEIKTGPSKAFFSSTQGVITSISIVIAFSSIVYAWGVSSANKVNDVSSLKNDVEDIRLIVAPLKPIIDTISKKLDRHTANQNISMSEITESIQDASKSIEEVSGKQDKLKSLVTTEFAKGMTPQQVLDMVNYLEKKNNGMNSYLTPYEKLNCGKITNALSELTKSNP